MKTTVDIPDELYGQARKLAVARGQQVAALITEALQKLVVAQLPRRPGKAGKNGNSRQTILSPGAARWLTEWRALGRRITPKGTPAPSAAKIVSGMRR